MANLMQELAAAIASGGLDEIPDGWLTCAQHAKAAGLGRSRTTEILSDGVAAGKVQQRNFRVMTTSGIRVIPHYLVQL